MDVPLVLLLGDLGRLVLGQLPSDRSGLLVSEVKGHVLGVLVELPEVVSLLLVDDGEDSGDRLSNSVAKGITARVTRVVSWTVEGNTRSDLSRLSGPSLAPSA